MNKPARIARIVTAAVAVLGLTAAGVIGADAAYAADTISITPTTTSAASNSPVTYTLTVSCSTSGGCLNSAVTIPTTTLTGDGSTTDFSSWFTNGNCPAMTKSAGQVSFAYGTVATGTSSCTFTVRAPNKSTRNGAQATLTPTFTNAAGSVTAAGATLSLTAGHNASLGGSATASVFSGGTDTLTFTMGCGSGTGDLGLTALSISDALPSNFTFTSVSTAPVVLQGTINAPAPGSTGGTITYTGDGSDCLNPANNRIVFTVSGTSTSAGGVADPVSSTVCHTPTSSFTYLDGFTDTSSPGQKCSTVVDINYLASKGDTAKTMGNGGQYTALDGSTPGRYTFPGDWDQTGGDTDFTLSAATSPSTTASGVSYAIQDPLPCMTSPVGADYNSNTPGVACANPAYVPRTITVTGFVPAAGAKINLLYATGATGTVSYVSGTGWTLPTSPVISEIDIPAFTEEGSNTFGTMTFTVAGYAAATAAPGHILANVSTTTAYFSGTTTAIKTPQLRGASILIADPASPSGTVLYPGLTSTYVVGCTDHVTFSSTANGALHNQIEIARAPSQAVYFAYLSPQNAGAITGTTQTFTFVGPGGRTYTASGVAASTTANYEGTGRTLVEWTIPAGVITTPGLYSIGSSSAISVSLPAGCAGTYQNALTLGYGGPVTACFWDDYTSASVQAPPMAPPGDPELNTDGSPIPNNYCGFSAPLQVTATNPGFSVDKTVQGNLDASAVSAGGVGKVTPTGGSAKYDVTFTNTGQSNLHDPVMYDLLPRVGDTEASSTTARGSQFPVQLTGVATPPAGVTVSYSTATNPCRPEVLANTSNLGCVDDWSTTPPSPLTDTTALRIAYAGTVGVLGAPFAQSFDVSYTASTPTIPVGDEAWNTVGANAHIGDTGDDATTDDPFLGAAESSRTGLTASTNSPLIAKAAAQSTYTAVGDEIDYTFDVTNTELVPLTGVTVTDLFTDAPGTATAPAVTCDSLANPTDSCSGSTAALLPGQIAHFVATYHVTQADIDHGLLTDSAVVTGQPASGGTISNTSNSVTVTAVADRSLSLLKSASPTSVSAVGDEVDYGFVLDNLGNQTLHGLAVDDPMFSSVTCPVTTLAPGDTTTCSATYDATQADLDAGTISNTASASGFGPGNESVTSNQSTANVTAIQSAHLTLTKSASPTSIGAVGDGVTFTFHVVNDGNVSLTQVGIDEGTFTGTGPLSAVNCPGTTLAPADTMDCTATYVATQDDLNAGSVSNTATAVGVDPSSATTISDASTATVAATANAALSLAKTADVTKVSTAGQRVTYSFLIANSGNVTVTSVIVQEGTFTGTGGLSAVSCPGGAASLAPGDSITCTATYSVTTADLHNSTLSNTAVASGSTASGSVASTNSTAVITMDPPVTPVLGYTGVDDVMTGVTLGFGLFGIGFVILLFRRRRNA